MIARDTPKKLIQDHDKAGSPIMLYFFFPFKHVIDIIWFVLETAMMSAA